ncbi:hypothetical protein D3C73_465840 [compost metagenome]|jgi:hypothetical protein|nr:hypothetical protein [Sphingobacterium sp. BIGb0116]
MKTINKENGKDINFVNAIYILSLKITRPIRHLKQSRFERSLLATELQKDLYISWFCCASS